MMSVKVRVWVGCHLTDPTLWMMASIEETMQNLRQPTQASVVSAKS